MRNTVVEEMQTILREALQGRFPEGVIPILRPKNEHELVARGM